MVLVDTSVWVEVFRLGSTLSLESDVDPDEVVTCLPVIQEVLQGFDDERAYRVARESMLALPILEDPLTLQTYERAVDLYRRSRRAGSTVRSGVDCLIASCALMHDVEVVHCDRDFDVLASVSTLRSRNLRPGRTKRH